jgi:hypothetical protein
VCHDRGGCQALAEITGDDGRTCSLSNVMIAVSHALSAREMICAWYQAA